MLLPGLAAGPAAAAPCSDMVMPVVALKSVGRGFSARHAGIDLIAPFGTPVRAAAAGTVAFVGWSSGYGYTVEVQHGAGLSTRYGHLAGFLYGLHAGSPVQAGDLIGAIGATGNATGPHLHFELRIAGRPIDPLPALQLATCPADPLVQAQAPAAEAGTK